MSDDSNESTEAEEAARNLAAWSALIKSRIERFRADKATLLAGEESRAKMLVSRQAIETK